MAEPSTAQIRFGTPAARWVLAATVLGSGIAFLDGTVVNVALPTIGEDLETSLGGMQWVVNAYLVTLSALLLLGGSLGDRFGRRTVFVAGLGAFTAASVLCGIAPSVGFLIAARAVQGIGGALLVPGSLSIISASFHADDRGKAVGAWSGLAGVATALGPFLGGWLIDSVSWRWIFLINVPLAAIAIGIALRHVPETKDPDAGHIDLAGAALVTVGLGAVSYAAIENTSSWSAPVGVLGALVLVGFFFVERAAAHPMLPLGIFRSRQFSGANLTTLAVYAALSGALFLVVLRLQVSLEYSALEAGASLVPFTVLMLLLSPAAGDAGQRYGPALPMTIGPIVAAIGLVLFGWVDPGDGFVSGVLPAVLVFGLGLSITVAPLTAAVLGSVEDRRAGVASGINNAVSRLAGLLAVAILPAAAGIATDENLADSLDAGYGTALNIAAVLCFAGGVIAALVVRTGAPTRHMVHPSPTMACQDPCVAQEPVSAAAGASEPAG